MSRIVTRLVLLLALGGAFGSGLVVQATSSAPASLVCTGTQPPAKASAATTTPEAPAGMGWG